MTAHFIKDESIAIQLPQAESAVSREQDAAVEVVLDAQGRMHLDKQIVDAEFLEQQLRQLLLTRDRKWVTLRGDQGADLGKAVAILDVARKAGAETVEVVTEQP